MIHPQRKYRHLFFDLDRTLWDFETNNLKSFHELFQYFELKQKGIDDFDHFFEEYHIINHALWEAYKKQEVTREHLNFHRFHDTLCLFGVNEPDLATRMGDHYLKISPYKTALYPGTIDLLLKLQDQYNMHIITNGFEDVQFIKMEQSKLDGYFQTIITSEEAGVKKPDQGIFDYALRKAGASAKESLMIGDDVEADILGAANAGIDQVWVKHPPLKPEIIKPTYEVDNLDDIRRILL